jgi:hypothetical protein
MTARRLIAVTIVAYIAALAGCGVSDGEAYTLYRDSAVTHDARMHVASFDTREGAKYNNDNCQQVLALFQTQPGVTVRFWCEKGRYRK